MFLTLYYMYATFMQWWRIGVTRAKISEISNQSSIILYQKEKCVDRYLSNLEDVVFLTDEKVGCTVVPKKKMSLRNWLPFSTSSLFPFASHKNNLKLAPPNFTVLIHADLKTFNTGWDYDKLQISDLGIPIAWNAAENFGIVLKTDLDNFSKLVSCFLVNSIAINEGMEVLQIETIEIEEDPKTVEIERVCKKIKWPSIVNNQKQWNRYVDDLKTICKKVNQLCGIQNGNIHTDKHVNKLAQFAIKSNDDEQKISTKTHLSVANNQLETIATKQKTRSDQKVDKKTHKKTLNAEKTSSPEKNSRTEKASSLEKTSKSKKNSKEYQPSKERLKTSSSMDRIKHFSNKEPPVKEMVGNKEHKKDLHKSKREKFAKRHSDDKLLNKDVKVDKDMLLMSKHEAKKLEKEENVIEEKEIDETTAHRKKFIKAKPPNVLVYADSLETKENVKTVLKDVLNRDKYTIYELPSTGDPYFADNSILVVVCGSVTPNLTTQLLHYLLNGGNLLCLCSDFLNTVLHTFTTAEVREHELVRFSYGEWKRVKMMHHIFCYQASPVKKHFSQDSDANSSNQSSGNSPVAPRTPSVVELNHNNKSYLVQVQVLGTEETWHTPSILLAKVKSGTGKAVFSQVHLEIDPTQYQDDDSKNETSLQRNSTRLEILKDILCVHLNMDCTNEVKPVEDYTVAYMLGKNDVKLEMLNELPEIVDNTLKLPKLTLQFCVKGVKPATPFVNLMPVLVHSCPDNFSTVEYFENLLTQFIGRLVIYSNVMTTSMDVITGMKLKHGLVVIPRQQTLGTGRGGNIWLSPSGCIMFSLQLHIPTDSVIGKTLPLVQHLVSVSVVSAIRSLPGYENIEIGLKWPNDIYANSSVKIGGLIVNMTIESSLAICNIGCGINLANSLPTMCINAMIDNYNQVNGTSLKVLSYEKFLALIFTEIERVLDVVQSGNMDYLFELYYKYWLHKDSIVTVQTSKNILKDVTITGIDEFGFLTVRSRDGSTSSVQPDGNSFDMMQGLIAPKIR